MIDLKRITLLGAMVFSIPLSVQGENTGKIVSAGLFKNGLVMIERAYHVPGPGHHEFVGNLSAVHGTLSITGPEGLRVRTGTREVSLSSEELPPGGPATLIGNRVELRFRGGTQEPAFGTLLATPTGSVSSGGDGDLSHSSVHGFYVLAQEGGHRRYIDPSTVVEIVTGGEALVLPERKRTERVLTFEVPDSHPGVATISVSYLTRGMAWAPSYTLDTSDPKRLRITQTAVVRNELEDLDDAELSLISGYPSVEHDNVTSPLSTSGTWQRFFRQLQQGESPPAGFTNQISSISNVSTLFSADPQGAMGTENTSEGPDIHYQPIGSVSLKHNEAMTLTLASEEVAYDAVVEWNVRPSDQEGEVADVWEALRFKNPFAFPMTTGPAMVVSQGEFLGSRTSNWVSVGGEAMVYVTRALSVQVGVSEEEVGERTEFSLARRHYTQSTLEGTLQMRNLRSEALTLIVRKEVSGALLDVEGTPQQVVGSAGPGQLNPSTKLTWTLEIPPGDVKRLTYQYTFLRD